MHISNLTTATVGELIRCTLCGEGHLCNVQRISSPTVDRALDSVIIDR
jgi:hypothetical protein